MEGANEFTAARFADMSAAIALPIAIVVALVLYFLCCKLFVKKAA